VPTGGTVPDGCLPLVVPGCLPGFLMKWLFWDTGCGALLIVFT
jgi:hypothetical protein